MATTKLLITVLLAALFVQAALGEAEAEKKDDATKTETAEDEPLLSPLDIAVLGVVGLGGIYYMFFRKKQEVSHRLCEKQYQD